MLEKKLLTLACALGILGIGACFLPPPRPPAVLLPPYMAGTRVLAIDVQDASPNEPFESTPLSRAAAAAYNRQWNDSLHAVSRHSSATASATLFITILSKQAIRSQPVGVRTGYSWNLTLATRMELVGENGRRIWLRDGPPITYTGWPVVSKTPFSWKEKGVLDFVAYDLAKRAGSTIQNPNSFNAPPEHP